MGGETRDAGCDARHHDGTDLRPVAGEHDEDVGDVVGHEPSDQAGLHDAMRDDDGHRLGVVDDAGARGRERTGDRGPHDLGDAVADDEGDGAGLAIRPGEHSPESAGDVVATALRSSEGHRDGFECRVGDAELELADEPELPGLGVLEHGGGVGTELQDRGGAPDGRVRGIDAEHAAILPRRARCETALHSPGGLWRSRSRHTGR